RLIKDGRVRRSRIGAAVQTVALPKALSQRLGLEQPGGVLIADVESGGPAERAGIGEGDVLVSFDGRPGRRSGDLRQVVTDGRGGGGTQIAVGRDGESRGLEIIPGEARG